MLVLAIAGLLISGFLPWYSFGNRFRGNEVINGFDEPLTMILPAALLIGLLLAADAIAGHVARPFLGLPGTPARFRILVLAGLGVFGLVTFKYLYRTDGATTGLYLAMGAAALAAYECYAIAVTEPALAPRAPATNPFYDQAGPEAQTPQATGQPQPPGPATPQSQGGPVAHTGPQQPQQPNPGAAPAPEHRPPSPPRPPNAPSDERPDEGWQ